MVRIGVAAIAAPMLLTGVAAAQQPPAAPPPDFSKVEIKTTNPGDNIYMLEGQGGNITVAVAKDGIIMVDGEYAPLHDKIKAAIADVSKDLDAKWASTELASTNFIRVVYHSLADKRGGKNDAGKGTR